MSQRTWALFPAVGPQAETRPAPGPGQRRLCLASSPAVGVTVLTLGWAVTAVPWWGWPWRKGPPGAGRRACAALSHLGARTEGSSRSSAPGQRSSVGGPVPQGLFVNIWGRFGLSQLQGQGYVSNNAQDSPCGRITWPRIPGACRPRSPAPHSASASS